MDPYDLYMKEKEDWQNEISKRDEKIKELEDKLKFRHLPGPDCKRWIEVEERIEAIICEGGD
jgi:hypothetical protein